MLFLRWSLNYDFGEVQPETVGGILAASPENTGGKYLVGWKTPTEILSGENGGGISTPNTGGDTSGSNHISIAIFGYISYFV